MNSMRWAAAIGWATALAILAGGCATYVNIPAHPGDVAVNEPNLTNVQQVATAALAAVLEDQPIDGPFQFVLPPGTQPDRYQAVASALGENARWAIEPPGGNLPVLNLAQVRIRGWIAEADVIRPVDPRQPQGFHQLVTADLKWNFVHNWHVTRLRTWRVNVDEALRRSAASEMTNPPLTPAGEPR